MMKLYLLSARIAGLGLNKYYSPEDQDFSVPPDIFTLAPPENVLKKMDDSSIIVSLTDPPVGVLLRNPRTPTEGRVVWTRRGLISNNGYRSFHSIAKFVIAAQEGKMTIGNTYMFEGNFDSWKSVATVCRTFFKSIAPHRRELDSVGSAREWSEATKELAVRLAAMDASPQWPRQLIVRLARDIKCLSIYPAIAAQVLIDSLLMCNRPTDEGVILQGTFQFASKEISLHLLVTQREICWTSRQSIDHPWRVHNLAFAVMPTVRRTLERDPYTRRLWSIGFTLADSTTCLTLTRRDTNASEDLIVLLNALYELVVAKSSLM